MAGRRKRIMGSSGSLASLGSDGGTGDRGRFYKGPVDASIVPAARRDITPVGRPLAWECGMRLARPLFDQSKETTMDRRNHDGNELYKGHDVASLGPSDSSDS